MRKRYLYLTGGLGNQLFQYAALQSENTDTKLLIDVVSGEPRVNSTGDPDILDFKLSDNLAILTRRMPTLSKRAIGYSLRLHINHGSSLFRKAFRFLVRLATGTLVSLHFREPVFLRVMENLGDDGRSEPKRENILLVGYFQSIRWAETLLDKSQFDFTLRHPSARVNEYSALAESEEPLVVHIRLGDYLAESGFGIPGAEYYSEAISSQLASNKYKKIWLFSDEPEKALNIFPKDPGIDVRIIEQNGLSSAETLEIMRLGRGYVIANSSFSYWGAYLSYSTNAPVICPKPWFKDLDEPQNLIPEDWKRADARF